MRKYRDLTGEKFGRLLVLERAPNSWDGKPMWRCLCDCGNETIKYGSAISSGNTKSCGCYRRELPKTTRRVHGGMTRGERERLYSVWNMMKQRCNDPNNRAYGNYGGRGIRVCEQWSDSYEAFRFWALANGYDDSAKPHACTIDRIDNDGDYCPENCRWVDALTQANNTSKNRLISFNGETKTLAEWGRATGILRGTITHRLKNGWSVEKALTVKPRIGANQYVK